MKRFIFAGCAALVLASSPAIGRTIPILELPRLTLTLKSTAQQTADDVAAAILIGSAEHEWVVTKKEPGRLVLKQTRRSGFWVTVQIIYDNLGYEIKYLDSEGMNYHKEGDTFEIDPFYNRWMTILTKSINDAAK